MVKEKQTHLKIFAISFTIYAIAIAIELHTTLSESRIKGVVPSDHQIFFHQKEKKTQTKRINNYSVELSALWFCWWFFFSVRQLKFNLLKQLEMKMLGNNEKRV